MRIGNLPPFLIRLPALLCFALALSALAQPARIVSTSPSITETLFALGAGARVVGVSNYCRFPAEALALPKVGTYTKPDPEKIALLRPDLVIMQRSPGGLADRLSALGIRHVEVRVGALSEVYSMILDIGRAVGLPEKAEQLDAKLRSQLEAIRSSRGTEARPAALVVVGRDPGLLTNLVAVGPGSYLDELLNIAGGRNVLTGTPVAYPHISLETVVRLDPDVILDLSIMGSAGGSAAEQVQREARARQPWLARSELASAQKGRVFALASEALTTPGPRVVEAVELIRSKIHQGSHP
jgi:iron complex transport system substrate-binding protein